MDQPKYTVAALFAGVGGFCQAFKNEGFEVTWANELDTFAVQTYKHNFKEVNVLNKSITDLSVAGNSLSSVDVMTAGFPCQPFSVAGNKMGFKDPRGALFFEIIRLVKEFGAQRPKILLLENVKHLLFHDNGKTFSRIVNEIQGAGYWFKERNTSILNTCAHTDIPQNRERLYMVAYSWECFDFNDFQFPPEVNNTNNVENYLDLNKKAPAEYYFDVKSKYGKIFSDAMKAGNEKSIYQLRRYYARELKDFLVPTLTANMGCGGHNKPVIKDKWGIRNLTPKECLRLQGFPEEFEFPELISQTQRYKQVGNSVTVPLVQKMAHECRVMLSKVNED